MRKKQLVVPIAWREFPWLSHITFELCKKSFSMCTFLFIAAIATVRKQNMFYQMEWNEKCTATSINTSKAFLSFLLNGNWVFPLLFFSLLRERKGNENFSFYCALFWSKLLFPFPHMRNSLKAITKFIQTFK